MTLTTHALVGASVAALFPSSPSLALGAALASHFLVDAIPHWHYQLRSAVGDTDNPLDADMVIGRLFFVDLF